jgi:hypothetical protein
MAIVQFLFLSRRFHKAELNSLSAQTKLMPFGYKQRLTVPRQRVADNRITDSRTRNTLFGAHCQKHTVVTREYPAGKYHEKQQTYFVGIVPQLVYTFSVLLNRNSPFFCLPERNNR